jgi:hypothetical protein
MPDWKALLEQRLRLNNISTPEKEEIFTELASHLTDLYKQYRAQGRSEAAAIAHALTEVTDWRGLAKTIQRAKLEEGAMRDRTKRLWLPGLVSTVIAVVLPILLLITLIRIGVEPERYHAGMIGPLCLLTCALGGAAGAYLSRRSGGTHITRLAAAVFPVVLLVVAIGCFIVLVRPFGAPQFMSWSERARFFQTTSLYGVASLLGSLPFLRSRPRTESRVTND